MGMSSFLCPICELPVMASISIGTQLSHVALVRPNGDLISGTYTGYGQLDGVEGAIELWPLIQYEDSWEAGWGDGDGILVHQACLPEAVELIRKGSEFPQMQRDLGQGHFYAQWQVAEFLAQLGKRNDLSKYSLKFVESNVFAKLDKEEYRQGNLSCCPVCGSGMVEGGCIDVNEGRAYQDIICTECGSSWTDVYKLDTYSNLEVSEEGRQLSDGS
jgi:transposase-like protein